jgi:hypothetical protein
LLSIYRPSSYYVHDCLLFNYTITLKYLDPCEICVIDTNTRTDIIFVCNTNT